MVHIFYLELDLFGTVLPEGEVCCTVWRQLANKKHYRSVMTHTSNPILAVVEQGNHAIDVHALAGKLQSNGISERIRLEGSNWIAQIQSP